MIKGYMCTQERSEGGEQEMYFGAEEGEPVQICKMPLRIPSHEEWHFYSL